MNDDLLLKHVFTVMINVMHYKLLKSSNTIYVESFQILYLKLCLRIMSKEKPVKKIIAQKLYSRDFVSQCSFSGEGGHYFFLTYFIVPSFSDF